MIRRFASALALVCALPFRAPAQAPIAPPESVTAQFIQSMRVLDWPGMARLMHPAALHQLHDLLGAVVEAPGAEQVRQEVLGVRSIQEARAMSDTALFAAFMKAVVGSDPIFATLMKSAQLQVIGHVNESPDTVHVVYRMTMLVDSMPMSRLDVASFARTAAGWRGLLKGDVTAIAVRLKRMLESAR